MRIIQRSSRALTSEHLQNFGEMANMECLLIDQGNQDCRFRERVEVERYVLRLDESMRWAETKYPGVILRDFSPEGPWVYRHGLGLES